jgi:anti-anti-sigma factor
MLERSVVSVLTPLHLETTCPSPGTVRVAVIGEVDIATATVLRDRLLDALDGQRPSVLEVDLAGVTFLDCAGLGALLAARNAAVRTGGQMRVTHPQPFVRRILAVTGLLTLFATPIDQPEALVPESGYRSRRRPAPATVMQLSDVVVAA